LVAAAIAPSMRTVAGERRGVKRSRERPGAPVFVIDRVGARHHHAGLFFIVNIEIKDVSATRKNMVVTLTQGEVDTEHAAVVAEFAKYARIPGFRPGKTPVAMVRRQFARQIDEDFKQKITAKAYQDSLKESKIDVLNIIDLQTGDIKAGAEAVITVTIDVRPAFELPGYNGIAVTIAPVDPAAGEIDAAIDAMRAENAKFEPSQGPAKKGDYIKLAYEGAIDGKPMDELVGEDKKIYAKVPTTWEEVEGENEGLIPGLGKHLAGVVPGDKKNVDATFPAGFTAVPALAGKTATYAVEVQEIRVRALPALDGEFFKTVQADGLDALKKRVENELRSRKEHENRQAQRRQITEALNAAVNIEIPASLLEDETQNVLRNIIGENMRRGVPEEQFEKDKKMLHDHSQKAAFTRVKTRLILAKIAEREEVKVEERDIDAFVYREAMSTRERPDKIAKDLEKDRERLRAVHQSILLDKTMDLIVANAKVTTVANRSETPKT
jgi:trigger factor